MGEGIEGLAVEVGEGDRRGGAILVRGWGDIGHGGEGLFRV